MDHTLIERRAEPRLPREALRMAQATLRPGYPVEVVDLSPRGIQVESGRPIRPGSRVLVRVIAGDQTLSVGAVVLRCSVWALDPADGVTYRGGLRFDERCLPFWEQQARESHLLQAASLEPPVSAESATRSGGASRAAASPLPQRLPVFSVIAPCQPGVSAPKTETDSADSDHN